MTYTFPPQVNALSCDIWRTLLVGNSAFTRPRLRRTFDLLGHPGIDVEKLRTAYMRANKFYNEESERQLRDFGLSERLEMMYQDLGIMSSVPGESALRAIQVEVGKLRLQPDFMPTFIEPDLPETLRALRDQGLALGLLSNTGIDNEVVMESVLRKLGIWDFFDVHLFSCEDGRAKPHPELFRHMAKRLRAEPQQVLHIGDNPNADCRATEAGLHAVLYTPKGAPEGNTLPFITSMKELLKDK